MGDRGSQYGTQTPSSFQTPPDFQFSQRHPPSTASPFESQRADYAGYPYQSTQMYQNPREPGYANPYGAQHPQQPVPPERQLPSTYSSQAGVNPSYGRGYEDAQFQGNYPGGRPGMSQQQSYQSSQTDPFQRSLPPPGHGGTAQPQGGTAYGQYGQGSAPSADAGGLMPLPSTPTSGAPSHGAFTYRQRPGGNG